MVLVLDFGFDGMFLDYVFLGIRWFWVNLVVYLRISTFCGVGVI